MSAALPKLETERTPEGEQALVPGVAPISQRQRLEARMAAPMLPPRPQQTLDFGLFDEAARNQLDLFGTSGRTPPAPDPLPP